jgi:hypothetical protein
MVRALAIAFTVAAAASAGALELEPLEPPARASLQPPRPPQPPKSPPESTERYSYTDLRLAAFSGYCNWSSEMPAAGSGGAADGTFRTNVDLRASLTVSWGGKLALSLGGSITYEEGDLRVAGSSLMTYAGELGLVIPLNLTRHSQLELSGLAGFGGSGLNNNQKGSSWDQSWVVELGATGAYLYTFDSGFQLGFAANLMYRWFGFGNGIFAVAGPVLGARM